MADALHELLTWITIGGAVAWLVQHFVRRPESCDACPSCDGASPMRSPSRGVRPAALVVLPPGSGR